jgi:hypothetical protein
VRQRVVTLRKRTSEREEALGAPRFLPSEVDKQPTATERSHVARPSRFFRDILSNRQGQNAGTRTPGGGRNMLRVCSKKMYLLHHIYVSKECSFNDDRTVLHFFKFFIFTFFFDLALISRHLRQCLVGLVDLVD